MLFVVRNGRVGTLGQLARAQAAGVGLWDPRRFGASWKEPVEDEYGVKHPARVVEAYPGAGRPMREGLEPEEYADYSLDLGNQFRRTRERPGLQGLRGLGGALDSPMLSGGFVKVGPSASVISEMRAAPQSYAIPESGVVRFTTEVWLKVKSLADGKKYAVPGSIAAQIWPDWREAIAAASGRAATTGSQERAAIKREMVRADAQDEASNKKIAAKIEEHYSLENIAGRAYDDVVGKPVAKVKKGVVMLVGFAAAAAALALWFKFKDR